LAFESARAAESSRIFLVDRDGRNVRQLHPNDRNQQQGQPAWSPDGRFIAYWAGLFRDHSAVYVKRLGRPKTVLLPAFDATHYDFEDGFVWRPFAH
jgi:Tol biopolymer transport system component